MKRLFTLVCLCGFLAAMVGPAAAQEKKAPDKKAQFTKMDKNSDGKVSKEEFTAAAKDDAAKEKRAKAFARLDKDKDGSLTLEEFSAVPKKKKPE